MGERVAPRHRRRPGLRWAVLVVVAVMVVVGGVLVGVAVTRQDQHEAAISKASVQKEQIDRRAASEARARSQQVTSTVPPPPAVVSTIEETGATLVIPALGVRAPIVAEGETDGSMTIPSDITSVGWYDGLDSTATTETGTTHTAPWPGQPGVALIAGHVDWAGKGPGALYYLNQLQPGDPIEVVGSNGFTTQWQVSEAPITISKSTLPSTLFVNTGTPKLALVTCGGAYDAATGHYLDNVIVWATPSGST